MASNGPTTTEVKEGIYKTRCTLCSLEMSQSKILPCLHTLCLVCLEDASKTMTLWISTDPEGHGKTLSKSLGNKMPCPLCEDEFTIPPEGLTALEANVFIQKQFMMRQLIESKHKYEDSDEVGSEDTENRIGENYSHQKLYKECLERHKTCNATKGHCVVGTNGNGLIHCGPNGVPDLCERHFLQLNLFCTECDKVLCQTCFQLSHQSHRIHDVNIYADNSKIEIQDIIEGLSVIESKVLINNEELDEERSGSFAHLEKVREEIVRSGAKLKDLIEEQVKTLLREVDSIEKKNEVETEKQKEINHRFSAKLAYFGSFCSEVLTKASASETCWATSKLSLRTDDLREQLKMTKSQSSALNISFQRAETDCFAKEKICNILGYIKDVADDQHRVCNQLQNIREIKTFAAEKEAKEISAMTILDEELFLASSRSSTVEVYDTRTLSFRRRWSAKTTIDTARPTTQDVDDIRSISSCSRNDSLYILHYKSTKICEILRTDGYGATIAQWITKYGHSLSVTEDGNVLVTNYWGNRVKEYRPEGKLIRKCDLSMFQGISHPSHAIKLNNGNFVLCHGLNSDKLHRVCVVEPGGCLLGSFGGCKGSGVDQLDDPFHLVLGADGCVFVADWKNGRVLELSSDVSRSREVLNREHGLRFPRCICVDLHTDQLFVADDQLKSCLVFDMKQTLIRTNH